MANPLSKPSSTLESAEQCLEDHDSKRYIKALRCSSFFASAWRGSRTLLLRRSDGQRDHRSHLLDLGLHHVSLAAGRSTIYPLHGLAVDVIRSYVRIPVSVGGHL